MSFWMGEFKKYRDLFAKPELTPLPRLTNDKVDGFKVAFTSPAGKVYGFLTVPKAPGKYPAIVSVPGAGPGATGVPMLADFVYLEMNVHTYDPDIPGKTINDSYKEVNEGGMYMYKNIPDREKTYFHNAVIGINIAVTWLAFHEKVAPGCLGYHGSSQGGAFGFILSGLNPAIRAAVCNVPAMCDHLGYKQGRLAGWPQFCRQMKNSPEIEAMAQYYDAMNFAAHIRNDVPVRVIVGLADRTCSPSSVYAAYNRIQSTDKKICRILSRRRRTPSNAPARSSRCALPSPCARWTTTTPCPPRKAGKSNCFHMSARNPKTSSLAPPPASPTIMSARPSA